MENISEREAIARITAGETRLFEIIIRRYNHDLYRAGRSYGFNHADTEDLMQETYLSAFCHLDQFGYRASFKTWLLRIMLNHCYHKTRKQRYLRETTVPSFAEEKSTPMFHHHSADADHALLNGELKHELEEAVSHIPADYRMVFTLRELTGLSVRETAEVLDISDANVKTRLNRAKKMLRKEITKRYSLEDIFEFNLIYCDRMVERVMARIHDSALAASEDTPK